MLFFISIIVLHLNQEKAMSFNIRTLLVALIFIIAGICVYGQDKPPHFLREPVFPGRINASLLGLRSFSYDAPTCDRNNTQINMIQYKDKILVVNYIDGSYGAESETMLILWQKFYEKYHRRKDLSIIFISYGDVEETLELTGSLGVRYPIFFRSLREDGSGPEFFPTTQIIDRDGVIIFSHTGYADWMTPKTETFLRQVSIRGS